MEQGVRKRIDQDVVWSVCDQLLAAGGRPTIERIRERIGGSPNTISLHLESWFKALSARMAAMARGEPVPPAEVGVPEAVLALAKQMWSTAREGAQAEARIQVEQAQREAEDKVAEAKEAERTADAVAQERGARILALELEVSRAEEAYRALEREQQQSAAELGHANGRAQEMERALLGAQSDV